jgi:hypothetical protein
MIKENFIDFLKRGTLRHFPFGIEELRVIKLLGQTDDHAEDMESSMIKYDWTEFYFYKGDKDSSRLYGILIHPVPLAADRFNFSMNYDWLDKKLDYTGTKAQLIQSKIEFAETFSGKSKKEKTLKTKSNVVFSFSKDGKSIVSVGRFLPLEEFEEIEI